MLEDLGSRIGGALRKMVDATVIDDKVVDEMLKEICNALVAADVNIKLVMTLRTKMKQRLALDELAAGVNKRKMIQKAVFDELVAMVDPAVKPFKPSKNKTNVIMYVGLQGSGKTTTVSKMAYHYKKKGWKACMVCADTFRAGAFDQLKQNATKVRVPYYGSYSETDPVRIAAEGVAKFKEEGFEIIIVDTSGRHKQAAELFDEMEQVAAAVNPDNIVFLMDGSIGQAAFDQAKAFKEKVPVGAVVITKMDGHAKGGGALSAVAATESPIIFLGTGEHMEDLESFDPQVFIQKLLGMGDIKGLVEVVKQLPQENQKELLEKIQSGETFTLRDMRDQFQTLMSLGPLNKVMEMLPGMGQMLKQMNMGGVDSNQKIKQFMCIMDSMTDKELDDPKWVTKKDQRDSRVTRIARGAGRSQREVSELIEQYRTFEKVMRGVGKAKIGKGGNISQRQMAQMANRMPKNFMSQMGGAQGMQNLMRQMNQMGM